MNPFQKPKRGACTEKIRFVAENLLYPTLLLFSMYLWQVSEKISCRYSLHSVLCRLVTCDKLISKYPFFCDTRETGFTFNEFICYFQVDNRPGIIN